MFSRSVLLRTRVVVGVVLLGGAMALGLSGGIPSDAAAQVVGLRSAGATAISAGFDHTCVLLSNHRVECWGRNGHGQLGNGKTTSSSTPVPVIGVTNATQV